MSQTPPPGVSAFAPPLVGTTPAISGISSVSKANYTAPCIMVTGREKDGKSSLAATLFGFPDSQRQPLIVAADPSGPDSCIALGYAVHAIKLNEMTGVRWFDRARSALDIIERNIATIRSQYGAVVFDDASTISYRMLEDARRSSKNPDPRSHYQTMYTQFNELWWRLGDIGMPLVWLAWMGEPGLTETGGTELAAPDIAGKKFARTIAGRSQHNFVLEKRMVGKGGPGADQHGYARFLHSVPWNGQNAGGRFGHLLPEPCPPDLSFILRTIRGTP